MNRVVEAGIAGLFAGAVVTGGCGGESSQQLIPVVYQVPAGQIDTTMGSRLTCGTLGDMSIEEPPGGPPEVTTQIVFPPLSATEFGTVIATNPGVKLKVKSTKEMSCANGNTPDVIERVEEALPTAYDAVFIESLAPTGPVPMPTATQATVLFQK